MGGETKVGEAMRGGNFETGGDDVVVLKDSVVR